MNISGNGHKEWFSFGELLWKREWRFTEEERHAFGEALRRHYQSLVEAALEEGLAPIERIETLAKIIEWTTIMSPAGLRDVFIFYFLVNEEICFLKNVPDDFEFDRCVCSVSEHIEALQAWSMRNLQ